MPAQIDKVAQELEVWQSQTAQWKAAVLVEAQKERSRREAFVDSERVNVKVSFHIEMSSTSPLLP